MPKFIIDTDAGTCTALVEMPARNAGPSDTSFGTDQFGTPYTSEADRARGEALRTGDANAAAAATAVAPGQLDIRTLDVEDLLYLDTFAGELQLYVGPPAEVHNFFNGATYGTTFGFANPNMQAFLNKKQATAMGQQPTFDPAQYTGPLRAVLSKHRGYQV